MVFKTIFPKQRQMRVVPVGAAVDATPSVAAYDRLREQVKKQKLIAVRPCPCRVQMEHLGQSCERPLETELALGFYAQYWLENGYGRVISVEEALEIIDAAEEAALVLAPVNTQEDIGNCMCCSCCCYWLRALNTLERPADYVQSSFQARINPALCQACGTCLERCQMVAVKEGEVMEVDQARCIGCGLCLSTCPEKAISMVPKPGAQVPSATFMGMMSRIAGERGLPSGRMKWLMNRISLPAFVKMWLFLDKVGLAKHISNLMARKGLV